MHITFLYTDYSFTNEGKFYIGIASLSSYVKKFGHTTSLIHVKYPMTETEIKKRVGELKPDLIAVSSLSTVFGSILSYIGYIKKHFDIPVVLGGVHPTLSPEETLGISGIDYICVGEGEEALLQLANALEKKGDPTAVANIWTKRNNTIVRNPSAALVVDLDTLPFPDRELFDYAKLVEVRYYQRAALMASRGCLYNCTYCCNHAIKAVYPNANKYHRFRSPENVMEEIEGIRAAYPQIRYLRFNDDSLTTQKEWFRKFSELYRKHAALPFTCMGRINELDDESIRVLGEIGCTKIELGLESGNEELRKLILNRHMSNEKIIEIVRKIQNAGIHATCFNMTGLPTETFKMFLDTVKVNALASPSVSTIFYFVPFQHTKLFDIAREMKMINQAEVTSFYENVTISSPEYPKEQINFAVKHFFQLKRRYKKAYEGPNGEERAAQLDRKLLNKNFNFRLHNTLFDITHLHQSLIIAIFYRWPMLYKLIANCSRIFKKTFLRNKMS